MREKHSDFLRIKSMFCLVVSHVIHYNYGDMTRTKRRLGLAVSTKGQNYYDEEEYSCLPWLCLT
jgi:hypothetical protein